ncbi:hypothetical protein N665_0413s0003 [Sinapis alba]|nr:hypothetical protein N665_0413s0003 [Sinapis alba]
MSLSSTLRPINANQSPSPSSGSNCFGIRSSSNSNIDNYHLRLHSPIKLFVGVFTWEGGGSKATEQKNKPEPPKDYIHVRARRGQATDRHSLAERVRREKISEKMTALQDIIPGSQDVISYRNIYEQQEANESRVSHPEWLHMQVDGSFNRTT